MPFALACRGSRAENPGATGSGCPRYSRRPVTISRRCRRFAARTALSLLVAFAGAGGEPGRRLVSEAAAAATSATRSTATAATRSTDSDTATTAEPAPARPRIALVLSGGGARGLSQIGVLQALEEEGIPIDGIAGTSMGAVLGGLYAAGVSADSLARLAVRRELFRSPSDWENLTAYQKWVLPPRTAGLYFSGWEYRLPRSLLNDFNVNWLLIEHTAYAALLAEEDFDRLPIPFRTQALDLYSGEVCVLRGGDFPRALRSSMAIPVAFPPIPTASPRRLFIDSGPKNNLPIHLARELGCDRVIAINCVGSWEERVVSEDPQQVARSLLKILSQRVDSLSVTGWDVWIQPRLGREAMMDFDHAPALIDAGYRAARGQMERIKALLAPGGRSPGVLDESAGAAGVAGVAGAAGARARAPSGIARPPEALTVAWVRLGERPSSFAWVPKRELRLEPGDRFTLDALGAGLRRLYATNHYESVWPRLTLVERSRVGITLELEERSPTYVSVGVLYDNRRNANVNVEVLRDNQLRLGETLYASLFVGDFLNGAEGGMRSSHLRGLPIGFDLQLASRQERYEQDRSDAFRRTSRAIQLGTSLAIGWSRLFQTGIRYEHDRGEGAGTGIDWSDHSTIVFGTYIEDGTDERELPSRGRRLGAQYEAHLEELAGRTPQRAALSASGSVPLGAASVTLAGRVAASSRASLPFRHRNRLDLTRATWGRFEPGLYSPVAGEAAAILALRPLANLSFWVRGVIGVRGPTVRKARREGEDQGMEVGLLQRTPLGPIHLGTAFERGRGASLFVQVGHDLARLP